MPANKIIVNALLFQVGWFVCVLLGSWWAVAYLVAALSIHFLFIVTPQQRRIEACTLSAFLAVGIVCESMFLKLDALSTSTDFPPIWLLLLWPLFGTLINHSLVWLQRSIPLAIGLTALSAPWSYYGGAMLSQTVNLGDSILMSMSIIGVVWCFVVSVALFVLRRLAPSAVSDG